VGGRTIQHSSAEIRLLDGSKKDAGRQVLSMAVILLARDQPMQRDRNVPNCHVGILFNLMQCQS
jgi:hypothetical protein